MNHVDIPNSADMGRPSPMPLRGAFEPISHIVAMDTATSDHGKGAPRTRDTSKEINEHVASLMTEKGAGLEAATACYLRWIRPNFRRVDDPNYFSWVPGAPSDAATLGDLLVTLDNPYSGSIPDAEGPIAAEQAVISLIASLVGYPQTAEGTFVSGGTAGNISALMVARENWRRQNPGNSDKRGVIVTSDAIHSSVLLAAKVIDCDLVTVPVDESERMTVASLDATLGNLSTDHRNRICALVGSAGTTNAGAIDDLTGLAALAQDIGVWFHVDGAYGGAAIFSERAKTSLSGLAHADSFIVDPHKWLFSPYDSCAVVYRDPDRVAGVFRQEADYLSPEVSASGTDPADLAPHLSRRARGLPLWWTLAVYGIEGVRRAVDSSVDLARWAADRIRTSERLTLLVAPELSVLLFTRRDWKSNDYRSWSRQWEEAGSGLVVPTQWRGEPALRLCLVNPDSTSDDIEAVLSSIEGGVR
jgi:L-2,4-diaminobutyrate decarboxylase